MPLLHHTHCTAIFILTASTLAMGSAKLNAADIEINQTFGVLDSSTYEHNSIDSAVETIYTPSSPSVELTADFSALGETTLSVTWEAPEGYLYNVYTPSGLDWEGGGYIIQFTFQFGSLTGTDGYTDFTVDSVSVGGSIGAEMPTYNTSFAYGTDGTDTTLETSIGFADFVVGETYQFSSVTTTMTIPDSYDGVFSSSSLTSATNIYLELVVYEDNENDPGQVLTLVAVPEPGAYALIIGLAMVVLALVRRCNRNRNAC
ncbi:hypothetical protein [Cerasicoccus frondis]|uniref:hypothetical protein n=1 Tax=Cerasicoccus frondis TaxID=490090 RepID=UPI0028526382|nr:hypothetical protein [Cerasicoccus frondis]